MRILLIAFFLNFSFLSFAQNRFEYKETTKEAYAELDLSILKREDYGEVMEKFKKQVESGRIYLSTKQYEINMELIGPMPDYNDVDFYAHWEKNMKQFTSKYFSINTFIKNL
jgi:hypothetical protein